MQIVHWGKEIQTLGWCFLILAGHFRPFKERIILEWSLALYFICWSVMDPKNLYDFTKALTSHSVKVTLLSVLHPSCELLVEDISLQASLCGFPGQERSHLFV